MNLTHRQFEILIAAADAESFSAAAQRLGISQPSLSKSIRRIEREIGALLFKRTTRSVKLTPEGRHAAAVAREIVRDFKRALERLASRSNNKQGRISIAALPSIACAVLPAVIEVFRREHSGMMSLCTTSSTRRSGIHRNRSRARLGPGHRRDRCSRLERDCDVSGCHFESGNRSTRAETNSCGVWPDEFNVPSPFCAYAMLRFYVLTSARYLKCSLAMV